MAADFPRFTEADLIKSFGQLDPERTNPAEVFLIAKQLLERQQLFTMVPLLPFLLRLNGDPYSLHEHFPFEDLFRFRLPRELVYMTGRQVAKSTGLASSSVIRCASIPNFRALYVTPLYEQIRRFSTNYVQPFINQSPVKSVWKTKDTKNSVLHQTFHNNSQMLFSYALLNADRVRGISADFVGFDEIQDMMRDHIPVIVEVMSHSKWNITQYTGTPKTLDNTLTGLWKNSSMAEWFIPCHHCTEGGYPTWNIPSKEYHLEKMIGPYRDDISYERPGVICHKCGEPILPHLGRWVHRQQGERWGREGRHIPQIIMPIHYANPEKWAILLAKQQGLGNIPINVFYNEVLGEPYDTAAKLVSMTELMEVSNLGENTLEHALKLRDSGRYVQVVLAVDWGGGGEKGVSFTTAAVLGMKHNGSIEVIYGQRLLTPHDHLREAREVRQLWNLFRPHIFAHDYTGAGSLRETFIVQSGIRLNQIMPCMYVRSASQRPCYHVAATPEHPRDHYRVDKSRSLLMTCAMIKQGRLRFFNWDRISMDNRGLISDFLELIEEKAQTMAAGEIYRIDRTEDGTDDFAQAVNIGCVAMWHRMRAWPNLVINPEASLTQAQIEAASPSVAFQGEEPDGQQDNH
jgi:hypothetical protein